MFTHRLQTHFFRRFSQVLVLLKVASSFGRRRYAFITKLAAFPSYGSPYTGAFFHVMQSSYGFVDYFDRRSAALAIVTLNGRHL